MEEKLKIEWRAPGQLVPYSKNAKVHSSSQIDKIAQQIAEFGFDQPIVVDRAGVIIKGHGRREAAIRLNLAQVPVIVSSLDEYQAIAARIADNKVAEAPWDPEMLKFDLGTLQRMDFKMDLTGFELPQVEEMISPPTSETLFTQNRHKSVAERREQYDNSDFRQIILVMEPEQFDQLMKNFAEAQEELGAETNVEVVEKLFEIYAETRMRANGQD